MNERQYNVRLELGKSKERHGWKGKKKRRFEEGPKSKSPIKTTIPEQKPHDNYVRIERRFVLQRH